MCNLLAIKSPTYCMAAGEMAACWLFVELRTVELHTAELCTD